MELTILANRLMDIWDSQAMWSQETFGSDKQKGPTGPLRHLEKEAREAQESPTDASEYADCLLLILDASRRAGFDLHALLYATQEKLKKNKTRDYGKAPVYVAGKPQHYDKILPPYHVWMTAYGEKSVCGWGFTEAEAIENGWANVRRLFDHPVEHNRA